MHLAMIMNERTQEEKETFGKINFKEKASDKGAPEFFTEAKIMLLLDTYLTELKLPLELVSLSLERSRSRF